MMTAFLILLLIPVGNIFLGGENVFFPTMPPRPLLWGMGGRFQITSDLHLGDTPPYELFGLCGAPFGLKLCVHFNYLGLK